MVSELIQILGPAVVQALALLARQLEDGGRDK